MAIMQPPTRIHLGSETEGGQIAVSVHRKTNLGEKEDAIICEV
jgi:hypothetical protein